MAACLTCEEIELKICELLDELATTVCNGAIIQEGDTKIDFSAGMDGKNAQLRILKELWDIKCKGGGAGELYEFVTVPCVKPVTCVGSSCRSTSRLVTGRRYR